ncbi:hypothetical protein ACFSSA_12240 [Luteolibacter algae]|uniref:CHASE2 domain-containing protein n=1 Tax=Luteolibacter algae TaxID=454151 RepID=A0ABW5DC24_9BACT
MKRRIPTILLCAATALLVWFLLPGSSVDKAIFKLTALTFAEKPYFITGSGAHDDPHTLRDFSSAQQSTPGTRPAVVSLGDDPDGFFQSSPPSPIDFAVILKNIQRLGQDSPAIAIPLAWQAADIISLTALDQQLDKFSAPVTCAPLSRNPVPSPIPAAFRRASIPLSDVNGDTALLPIVNRVSLPDIVLGNKTSLAGFTALESEPANDVPHLFARWEDRVVLSFQLLAALNHYGLQPSGVKIHLGEFVELGDGASYLPIDEFGRLSITPPTLRESKSVPAQNLIDAPDDLFAGTNFRPIVLRNDLSSSDVSSIAFSKSLVGTIASLADPHFTSSSYVFHRYSPAVELLAMGSLLCLIIGMGNYPRLDGKIPLLILIGLILLFHFALVPIAGAWLPTMPALAMVAIAVPLTRNHLLAIPASTVSLPEQKSDMEESKAEVPQIRKPATTVPAPSQSENITTTQGSEKITETAPEKPAAPNAPKRPAAKKAARKTVKKAAKKATPKSSRKRSNRKPRK